MKKVDLEHTHDFPEELDDWDFADHRDQSEMLEGFDAQLSRFGLELIVGDRGDDQIWIKIEKRKEG